MAQTARCEVEMTFSKTVPAAQADGEILKLIFNVGESTVTNLIDQPDGKVKLEATLTCDCFKDENRVYGTCLAQALRKRGVPFPAEAAKGCIKNGTNSPTPPRAQS